MACMCLQIILHVAVGGFVKQALITKGYFILR